MWFRSYTNLLSQASRTVAMGILTVGLLLIGFGVLIIVFRDVFAILAAAVFFAVGLSLSLAAVRMLWTHWRLSRGPSVPYRENVRIRTGDHSGRFDL
jgi:hypothetical protein